MTNSTKKLLSLVTIIVFFIMALASNPSKKAFSDTNRFIPANFNPNNGTLLIQKHPLNAKHNNQMVEYLTNNYPYKFEIVDVSDLKNTTGKYTDTKQYPFAIVWSWSQVISSSPSENTADLYGQFLDRSTGKIYPLIRSNNIYGADAYKPFFNAITNKFK